MATCYDNPEKCTGCHYCQTARDEGVGTYPLSPAEANRRDQRDADLAARVDAGMADPDYVADMNARIAARFENYRLNPEG